MGQTAQIPADIGKFLPAEGIKTQKKSPGVSTGAFL